MWNWRKYGTGADRCGGFRCCGIKWENGKSQTQNQLYLVVYKNLSPTFYAVYIIAGISDVLDGLVARKLNLQSSFGEKLDTVADICFVGTALYKEIRYGVIRENTKTTKTT